MGVQIHDDEKGHWYQINNKKLTGGLRPKAHFGFGPAAKKACAESAAEVKKKIAAGKFSIKGDNEKKTLREIGDALLVSGGHRRDSTLTSYADVLTHIYPALGTREVGLITVDDIKALLALWRTEGASKNSIKLRLNVLGVLINHCVREGILSHSPILKLEPAFRRSLRKRDTVGKVRAMSRTQLDQALDALEAYQRDTQVYPSSLAFSAFWLLLGRTGLRIGEAMALQADDIEMERATGQTCRRLLVQRRWYKGDDGPTKTSESRYVDLSDELAEHLDALLAEQTDKSGVEWIFTSSRSAEVPASYAYWRKHLIEATKQLKLGMKMSPHLFRHTFASQMLQEGGMKRLKYVSQQLGHAQTSMTLDTYAHFIPSEDHVAPVNTLDTGRALPRRSHASIRAISKYANHSRRKQLAS